jgi:hypothetical protein
MNKFFSIKHIGFVYAGFLVLFALEFLNNRLIKWGDGLY